VIGIRINNYEVVSLIGEGGMGNVYLARHPLIDRGAAIKVLHAQLAGDRGLVTRFFNEARAANAIRHPNIIDIIDVGFLPNTERPYLMMELLAGENLAKRIGRAGRLPIAQALDFARQTASALAAAHTKGIVHRDLKPENLYLVPHGSLPGREVVKVLDFGIAKLRSEIGPGQLQTQTGVLMGTPPYMSPEQCRGLTAEIDLRTDVYALGIILFEMVCGSPPFAADGFGDLLVMHIMQAPPAPRSRNPAVPEALEAIILKALAKAANERFASMADFEAALAAVPLPAGTLEGLAPLGPGPPLPLPQPVPAATAPETTTTFRASAGEVSSELEEMALPRSRRPMLFGAAALAVAGALYALVAAKGNRRPEDPPAAAGPAPAEPDPPVEPARTVRQPAVRAAASTPTPAVTPPAGQPDAGEAPRPAASRPGRKPTTAKPTGSRPARGGPEKW
jgi:eukaryotic-like serine/threonine-protein kinase